ncbi:Carbohydrate-binding fold [Trifolium repens]|nr:Carbohydrate-binding fold [Trifolium repens]
MKTFTSFSSKPLVHKLGSLSPSIAFHVPDKPFSCFTLPFRNDQKSSIFCLLKLVQNKGLYPFHAVPSENQEVELETVELQVQQSESEQTNELKFVRVEFQLLKDCDFGEQFLIVGDDPMLGSWNPLDALPLTWSDGHIWTVDLDMPAGKSIQYKFILKGKEGDIIWQPGSDRILPTWETVNRIIVCEDWENAELQKIVEENRLSQTNEEPQVLSEVLTSTEISDNSRDEKEFDLSNISGIEVEDTKNYAEEKLIDGTISSSMEKPMAIIAENIGSSEDHTESASHETNKKNVVQKSEESEDGPQNDDRINDLGYNENAAGLKNWEGTIVEGSLIDFEGGPVLVPGLTPPTEEETSPCEVVEEEKTAIEPSIEAFETQDQNIPELSKDQESDDESDDDTEVQISTTINGELNFHEEQFHLAPSIEEVSNSEPIHGNALRNDIDWGRETVKKFLTKFGLL